MIDAFDSRAIVIDVSVWAGDNSRTPPLMFLTVIKSDTSNTLLFFFHLSA